jgi:hypothetical protein
MPQKNVQSNFFKENPGVYDYDYQSSRAMNATECQSQSSSIDPLTGICSNHSGNSCEMDSQPTEPDASIVVNETVDTPTEVFGPGFAYETIDDMIRSADFDLGEYINDLLCARWLAPMFDPPASEIPSLDKRSPRSLYDMYTTGWIRGRGVDREGWQVETSDVEKICCLRQMLTLCCTVPRCGRCQSWYKMKESAFWYHMQFTHGQEHNEMTMEAAINPMTRYQLLQRSAI